MCFWNLEPYWTSYDFLQIMSDILTHRFDIVNASYCSRSTRVLSIRNCAKCLKIGDNKANTVRWGVIFISGIPSECLLCSYNRTVPPKIKLNNQNSLNNRWFFHFLSRRGKISLRCQIYCYFQYVGYETNLLIFSFRLMSMELAYDLFNESY